MFTRKKVIHFVLALSVLSLLAHSTRANAVEPGFELLPGAGFESDDWELYYSLDVHNNPYGDHRVELRAEPYGSLPTEGNSYLYIEATERDQGYGDDPYVSITSMFTLCNAVIRADLKMGHGYCDSTSTACRAVVELVDEYDFVRETVYNVPNSEQELIPIEFAIGLEPRRIRFAVYADGYSIDLAQTWMAIDNIRGNDDLISIYPDHGGNIGKVTVAIGNKNITEGATAKLARSGEPDIVGDPILVQGVALVATFDLAGSSPGAWDVVVTLPDQSTKTLSAGFLIEEGRPDKLWADLIGLNSIQPNTVRAYEIAYGNEGNTDMDSPVFSLSNPEHSINFAFQYMQIYRDSPIRVFAASASGIVGRLSPDFANGVNILIQAPSQTGQATLELSLVTTEGQQFDWDALSLYPPSSTTPEDWAALVTEARITLGETWDDVLAKVREMANQPGQKTEYFYDFDALLTYAIAVYGSSDEKHESDPLKVIDPNFIFVRPIGEIVTNPTRNFFITNGLLGTTEGDSFHQLAESIKICYPNANIYILDWDAYAGAQPGQVWGVAARVDAVGEEFYKKLIVMHVDQNISTFIGQSFGNYVNNGIAKKYGSVDKIIACNSAYEGGNYSPPDLRRYSKDAVSFHTWSAFDTQKKSLTTAYSLRRRILMDGSLNTVQG